MNPRIYLVYIVGVAVFGAIFFFYGMHVNNEPLLRSVPNPAFATTTFSAISPSTSSISVVQPLSLLFATTTAAQELGLGNRNSLPASEGMLFVFSAPGDYGFWMKDMHFPIDMIWMDSNFTITHIEQDVSPDTYPKSFYPGADSSYVLETNAGYSRKNNLSPGETLDLVKKSLEKVQ